MGLLVPASASAGAGSSWLTFPWVVLRLESEDRVMHGILTFLAEVGEHDWTSSSE